MLALPWRRYSTDDFSIAGKKLVIKETFNDSSQGTGLIVWDGAFVLSKFLERRYSEGGLKGKNVLELGAGVGLVGIAAHFLGAQMVYLTDLHYTLNNIQSNLEANAISDHSAKCLELDWFQTTYDYSALFDGKRIDVIVLADVVWIAELVLPLVIQLQLICQQHSPEVLIAHQTRSSKVDDLLFTTLRAHGFDICPLDATAAGTGFDSVPLYSIEKIEKNRRSKSQE